MMVVHWLTGILFRMKSNKTLSVVASCFLILLFFSGKSQAGILKIGKNFSIKSIKEGVVKAQPFDTLYIHSGLYKEQNILIEKSLSLIGVENPVLDGENNFEVLTINANSVLVSGLTIKNSGYSSMKDLAGIKVMNSRQFLIKNNTLINSYFAIHIANCDNFRIENNTIRGTPGTDEQSTGNAIHLWKCLYASIKNNDISGHRDGIYFEFVGNSYIEQNNSYNNLRYGLHFMFSNKDSYIENKFTDNGAGVAVMFSNHISMYRNIFSMNRGASAYGLLLKEISDGDIKDNLFENNTTGVLMEGTNRLHITKNSFNKNGYALRVQASCSNNTVHDNNFNGNTFDVATNGSLVLNNFDGNYWDKYEGYDLKRDGIGDVPYRPVSLFSMVTENIPIASIFIRSLIVFLLDRSEKIIPSITPENLVDNKPLMKPVAL